MNIKQIVIGTCAALVATVSLASTADAGWRFKHRHGWHHRHHWGVVVVAPRYYGNYCFVKKVHRYDDWGNIYVKRVRVCR